MTMYHQLAATTLLTAAVAILMVGCGNERQRAEDYQQTNLAEADAEPETTSEAAEPAIETSEPQPEASAPQVSEDDFRYAAHEGKIDVVRSAVEAGIDVNAADPVRSLTALHLAAYNGHSDIVRLLLAEDATIDCRDVEGKTPLIHASTGPFAETVQVLIEGGADVNAQESTEKFTPLMMAAGLGHPDVVKVLLRHDADPAMVDADGDSALDHAKTSGHTEVVELLQE